MRLLDSASLCLSEFFGDRIPQYLILSHTWGEDEITFQDIQDLEKARKKKSFRKLEQSCRKAHSDGFQWVWIDTCCIDKSSSAELSEAINSMYQWYRDSQICYAYLEDVLFLHAGVDAIGLQESRWFTRGWTLQELIAPSIVEFYDMNWSELGTKLSLLDTISEITGIEKRVLENSHHLDEVNVATRMSWTARRKTTRKEDEAYCLMGIFGVSMPLLYGEGHRAFYRLQEEILDVHEDYTIFAWTEEFGNFPGHANHPFRSSPGHADGILARSPANFQPLERWSEVSPVWPYSELYTSVSEAVLSVPHLANFIGGAWEIEPPTLTCRGLSISLPIRYKSEFEYQACLTCTRSSTDSANTQFLCLTLSAMYQRENIRPGNTQTYTTAAAGKLEFVPEAEVIDNPFEYATIYLARSSEPSAIKLAAPESRLPSGKVVTVLTEHCSILDSFVLWRHQDFNRILAPKERLTNDFSLFGSPPLWLAVPIQAVFRVNCHLTDAPLLVAFGTTANNSPWCDVLSKQDVWGKYITIDSVGSDSSDENGHGKSNNPVNDADLTEHRTTPKSFDAIKQLFEAPLSNTFKRPASCNNASKPPHIARRPMELFKSTSDRVSKRLPGITITVAARGAFDSRDKRYNLSISARESKL